MLPPCKYCGGETGPLLGSILLLKCMDCGRMQSGRRPAPAKTPVAPAPAEPVLTEISVHVAALQAGAVPLALFAVPLESMTAVESALREASLVFVDWPGPGRSRMVAAARGERLLRLFQCASLLPEGPRETLVALLRGAGVAEIEGAPETEAA